MKSNDNTPSINSPESSWHSLALCTSENAIAIIPIEFAKKYSILPISILKHQNEEVLVVATSLECQELEIKENLKLITDKKIILKRLKEETLDRAISFAYQNHRIKNNSSLLDIKSGSSIDSKKKHISLSDVKESLAPNLLQSVLIEAINKKASDIHIDSPSENTAVLSYRIDGKLKVQKQYDMSGATFKKLLRHILVLCELDITKMDYPQEGMFELSLDPIAIRLRISSLPTVSGNKLAIRLLYHPLLDDNSEVNQNIFDVLNIPNKYQLLYKSLLKKKGGLILVSGPTGSGKSTLLYSILQLATQDKSKNIITIEDPVERRIAGATQIEINNSNSLNYSTILKHLLRQDPDMVIISEIRDAETAATALESALSGSLILSTIHASNVPELILRLLELSCPPLSIASTVKLISSQRLLRKQCQECKQAVFDDSHLRKSLKIESHTPTYIANGCATCTQSGIDGRIAVYEFCEPTFELISSLANLFKNGPTNNDHNNLKNALKGSNYISFASSLRGMLIQGLISEEEAESILF